MSELLIKWLNSEIHLSKEITNISEDFKSGYLFAEILSKTKQLHNLHEFKNSSNKKDIIHNFCLLDQILLRMGIIMNEKDRNEIINGSNYTSKIYLLKIKQYLDKKCINIEQLNHRYSNDLQKLYNSYIFKNQNEKYLYNLKIRTENEKNNINKANNNSQTLTENNLNKYEKGGPLYLQLKKKYSHLELSDNEINFMLTEMKEEETKRKLLKDIIQKTEISRNRKCQSKEKTELNLWKSSIINLNKYKKEVLTEIWKPVNKHQKNFKIYLKKQEKDNIKRTESFDKNLNVFAIDNKIEEEPENNEDDDNTENKIDLKKILQMKNEVYMRQIKEKLEQKIKSKKDKEKRIRKRLKEEREMYERMNTEKNMKDMISKIEDNLSKRKKSKLKDIDNTMNNTKQLLEGQPIEERQRIKEVDELIIKELNKQNKKDEEKNENQKAVKHKIDMNITKVIKQRENKLKEIKEKEIKEQKEINEENNNEEINKEENKEETDIIKNDDDNKSSYSKLSSNDYGVNLIDEVFEIHNVNNKYDIQNRMKLFKTRLLFTEDSEEKFNKLPKLFNLDEEDNKEKTEIKKEQTKEKVQIINKNDSEIFDKDLFYEEMDKLNYENFLKESKKRKIKKEKKINIIKPVLNTIIDIADYIYDFQQSNNVDLIDNEKWDELMSRFKNNEDIKEKEEEIFEEKNELTEYLFDYGYKLDNNDNLMIFDYINYLSIFNDLIIPEQERGKKYKYYELYDEFYNTKGDLDIKEYEPKEEELENLTLPKYPNFYNYKFYEIIENSFKMKYNQIIPKNNLHHNKSSSALSLEIINQKGKYFYLPIKMSFIGYPLSGKKVQSNLISMKYPKIKIFDPQEIFENKLEEYKLLKEPVENTSKNKNLKPNQLELLNKERDEKLEKFKPILAIIKPYLDYTEEYNNTDNKMNLNLHETNFKEDILTDIYINLLLYELNLAFPDDIESKNKLIEEIQETYKEYLNVKEQIDEIKKKDEENIGSVDNKNKKNIQNNSKDLEILNKKMENVIQGLYVGFIFINFPKNEKQAKKLENKLTGFISEFEKEKDPVIEKIFNNENLLDINIKPNIKNIKQISMFDLFFNLNITSDEVDRRFKISKYDPSTKKIYNMEENPPSDKKILEKLIPGIPGFDEKKLNEEKILFEKNRSGICNFYKMMSNGTDCIYKNVETMDKIYVNNINNDIETFMEKIILGNYYKNLDIVIKNLSSENNNENNNNNLEEKEIKEESQKTEEKKEENKIMQSEQNIQITTEETKISNNLENSINIKEPEIKINIYNLSEDITDTFELFASDYQNLLTNFIHFLSRQKHHIDHYLTKIQDDFIVYINRKTDKENICQIYSDKYNSIIDNQPSLLQNKRIIDELLNDIEDIAKSLWLMIQNKKNEDIKYLLDIKENKKLNGELEKFWEYVMKIVENEVKKYLITCEIIIKYYLNEIGYLPEIIKNIKNNSSKPIPDEFLFKIDYSKYLFQGVDKSEIFNNLNFYEEEKEEIEVNIKEKENVEIKEENKNQENKEKINSIIENNKHEHEETKSNLNETNKISNNSSKPKNEQKIIEDNLQNLFINSLKIIIRQDLLMNQYKEKIKNHNSQEILKSKISTSKLNSSMVSSSSKNKNRKVTKPLYEEEFVNQIQIEKNKFKYRLMFLKNYIIKYLQIIIECFNTTYNTMDDWIILSVRKQNNSLNEFISYLKKIMNKQNKKVDLNNFEFDYFNIYSKNKVDISSIFDKLNLNSFINLKEKKEFNLININNISYSEKYVYNINDLMQIYNYLKSFGTEGCDYLIKYEIVKEILVHKLFAKRKYENQINDNNNINKLDIINEEENDKKNLGKNIKINFEENNGISKAIKFLSNINYINCLDTFSEYNNNYININELFTCLILIGSELITSEKFMENIKSQIKKENILYLTKEEFLDINFWFDEDKYLNSFADNKEEDFFKDEKNNGNKIKKIKTYIYEINEEEGKISLNKIINLLNKFDKRKNEDEEQSDINRETKKENEKIVEEKEDKEENINKSEEILIKTNDEITSPRNESEFLSSSNKKIEINEEINNNFFRGIFYNQQI